MHYSQVFRGNVDNNTPYANSFTPPIEAQFIRIYPQVCRRHCTLRMELLGCELSGQWSPHPGVKKQTNKQTNKDSEGKAKDKLPCSNDQTVILISGVNC